MPTQTNQGRTGIVAIVLVLVIAIVYARAINAPFMFDDRNAINANDSIRSLWPLLGTPDDPGPLRPAPGTPLAARPLVNLSLSLNYQLNGLVPFGYHAFNFTLHFLSTLLVWGIIRRTLKLPYFVRQFDSSADLPALAVAMLWALHPLQTEAVVYTTQRTELMVSLFYLATLYFSIRYWLSKGPHPIWLLLATLACLCGMASKEVMVSAPIIVLLYDRTFIAGSLSKALRRSWPLYAALASTWLLLLALNINSPRGDSAGFGLGLPIWSWWLTQCQVLVMYLKLVIWPSPLLIHYQWPYLDSFAAAWPYVFTVTLLLVATLVLLWRNSPLGFVGAWVFAVLAPTSLVPILLELAAERRMYLPLAPILAFSVIGPCFLLRSVSDAWKQLAAVAVVLLTIVYGVASWKRLSAYDDEARLWGDVLKVQPNNYIAHSVLGSIFLYQRNEVPQAIGEFEAALKLKPDHQNALINLGVSLSQTGRQSEAIEKLQAALALNPDSFAALDNLGIALLRARRFDEAHMHLEHLLQLQPRRADVHNLLGIVSYSSGKNADAIAHFKQAIKLDPSEADAHHNLGTLLTEPAQAAEAIAHLQEAVRLAPERSDYSYSLADALQHAGRTPQAIACYQAAIRLRPDFWQAHEGLIKSLAETNRRKEAIAAAETAMHVAENSGQTAAARQFQEMRSKLQSAFSMP